MGVFNLFIVIPQVVMSFITPYLIKHVLGTDPLNVVMLGRRQHARRRRLRPRRARRGDRVVPIGAVLDADEHTPLTTTLTAQPVPSTGLIDEEDSK